MPVYTNALAPRPANSLAYGPRNLMGTQMLQGPSESYLRQQFPQLYGFLGGVVGTAPDQMAGSVLDPNMAAVRQGAEYGFPVGTALGVLPAARFTKGLPVGMGIKSVGDNPLMNLPSGLTRQDQARLIQSHAENFAAKAKEMGLSASVEHSGSKAGPSSYVTVLDPITGAKFESPFRFSGHSKGPKESQFVYDVGDDFSNELGALEKMALSIPKAERDAIQSARQAKMIEDLSMQEKERIFSQGRPAVQSAMQEANLQQTPYTKAFSNSGKYIRANQSPYPQQAALDLAQQRAALPIEQGGLGLPAGNTAEQRAAAMGFDTDAYHGTTNDFLAFDKNKRGSATDQGWYGSGEYSSPSASGANAYAMTDFPNYKESANIIPLLLKNPESITNKHGYITEYVTREPENIRSRFAAFDPFRKSAAIAATMGVAAPDLLAAPAPASIADQIDSINEIIKKKRKK